MDKKIKRGGGKRLSKNETTLTLSTKNIRKNIELFQIFFTFTSHDYLLKIEDI
jgi:hypothetical protein